LFSIVVLGNPLDKTKARDYIPIHPGDFNEWKS
jgi:hypothetical protein